MLDEQEHVQWRIGRHDEVACIAIGQVHQALKVRFSLLLVDIDVGSRDGQGFDGVATVGRLDDDWSGGLHDEAPVDGQAGSVDRLTIS